METSSKNSSSAEHPRVVRGTVCNWEKFEKYKLYLNEPPTVGAGGRRGGG